MSTALRNARRSYHFPSHRVNREPPVNGNTALSAKVGQLGAAVRQLMARFVVDCGVVLRLAGDGLAVPDEHESCSRRRTATRIASFERSLFLVGRVFNFDGWASGRAP
jgi:hypothetical protein